MFSYITLTIALLVMDQALTALFMPISTQACTLESLTVLAPSPPPLALTHTHMRVACMQVLTCCSHTLTGIPWTLVVTDCDLYQETITVLNSVGERCELQLQVCVLCADCLFNYMFFCLAGALSLYSFFLHVCACLVNGL